MGAAAREHLCTSACICILTGCHTQATTVFSQIAAGHREMDRQSLLSLDFVLKGSKPYMYPKLKINI